MHLCSLQGNEELKVAPHEFEEIERLVPRSYDHLLMKEGAQLVKPSLSKW